MTALAPLLVVHRLREWSPDGVAAVVRPLAATFVPWLVGVPSVLHARMTTTPETRSYMDAFWYEGFLPLPVNEHAVSMWYIGFMRFLYDPVGMRWYALAWLFTVACAGVAWLLVRKQLTGWVMMAPVIGMLAFSLSGMYPIGARWTYSGRVVLFLAPLAYLLAVSGAAWIRYKPLAAIVTFLLVAPATLAAGRPHSRGEARDALAYAAGRAESDDVVDLHYALRYPYLYYQPAIRAQIFWGVCAQADRTTYIDELEQLRGTSRLWVVQAYDLNGEARLFREYMRLNALQADSVVLPLAEARLYSFPDAPPVSLPLRDLQTVAVPDQPTDCEGIFRPSPVSRLAPPDRGTRIGRLVDSESAAGKVSRRERQ